MFQQQDFLLNNFLFNYKKKVLLDIQNIKGKLLKGTVMQII